jgi:hypothetical protein
VAVTMRQPLAAVTALALACHASALGVGDQFTLRIGEQASIPAINLWVRFLEVSADSRCPSGAQCVVAGDATVLIDVAPFVGDAKTDTLHTSSDPRSVPVSNALLRLVRLDPYPAVGQTISPGDYVVTLTTDPAP